MENCFKEKCAKSRRLEIKFVLNPPELFIVYASKPFIFISPKMVKIYTGDAVCSGFLGGALDGVAGAAGGLAGRSASQSTIIIPFCSNL